MANKKEIIRQGILEDNPILFQIIGICSALAVTNRLMNSLIMGVALIFVTSASSFTISLLRNYTPNHIRMMVQVLIISVFVILVDIFLQAYMPAMSSELGPYVGLIITNCIIMGRAEAFAVNNGPIDSAIDGAAAGLGYTFVLLAIALIREILGFGTIFGFQVLPDTWTPWTLMIMAPSAFFILGIFIWIATSRKEKKNGGETK